jgi:anti-sigma-K factor RskA
VNYLFLRCRKHEHMTTWGEWEQNSNMWRRVLVLVGLAAGMAVVVRAASASRNIQTQGKGPASITLATRERANSSGNLLEG